MLVAGDSMQASQSMQDTRGPFLFAFMLPLSDDSAVMSKAISVPQYTYTYDLDMTIISAQTIPHPFVYRS